MSDDQDDKENAQPQQQQQQPMVSDSHSATHRQPTFTRIGPVTSDLSLTPSRCLHVLRRGSVRPTWP